MPREISFMCSVVCLVSDHAVAIGELPMDLWVKVGECVANIAVELTHAGFVGRHVWLRCVVDEVVREQLFKNVEPSFALDLFGIAAHHGLSCVRRCHGSHAFLTLVSVSKFSLGPHQKCAASSTALRLAAVRASSLASGLRSVGSTKISRMSVNPMKPRICLR